MNIIRGGMVVTEAGIVRADIGVEDGQIVAVGRRLDGDLLIDANGLHVFPGFFDAHVHFCDEGQERWEDFTTAGRAAVAGGVTTVMDMPLNEPATTTGLAFANRLSVIAPKAITDYALWAGCVPGNTGEMEEMRNLGARAFKAFMIDVPGYPWCDTAHLFDAMREAARLRVPLGIHAESHELVSLRRQRAIQEGRIGARDHAAVHDEFEEYEAVHRAIALAHETGCRLHVLHVNSVAALAEIAREPTVVGEAQIGFLTVDEDRYFEVGPRARFSPPARSRATIDRLWDGLASGTLRYVISDHSGYPLDLKDVASIWDAADGVPSVQTCYPVLLSEGVHKRGLSLERFVSLSSTQAARLYGLYPRKGAILPGVSDADLALVDLQREWELRADDLLYKNPWTIQEGLRVRGAVAATVRRGELVYADGEVLATPGSGVHL
jgi:allantoinase